MHTAVFGANEGENFSRVAETARLFAPAVAHPFATAAAHSLPADMTHFLAPSEGENFPDVA